MHLVMFMYVIPSCYKTTQSPQEGKKNPNPNMKSLYYLFIWVTKYVIGIKIRTGIGS